MPTPIDPRKKPAAVKIHVSTGAGVDITWSDNHASHYDFAYLREECPCATCNDEREKKSNFAAAGPASSAALPMFKPKPTAKSANAVGTTPSNSPSPMAIPPASTATTIFEPSA